MTTNEINQFWNDKLGIDIALLAPKSIAYSSRGQYVDKFGDRFVFLWEDLVSGARVFLGAQKNLLQFANLQNRNVRFHDLDYLLPNAAPLAPTAETFATFQNPKGYVSKVLSCRDDDQIAEFYGDCSADDRDTLDLDLNLNTSEDGETAFAYLRDGKIAGIVRYLPVKNSRIADITVVVRQSERGRKLSTPLVAIALADILRKNLIPKYRVAKDLMASRRVAEKLGMIASFQILAYEIG